MLKSGVWVLSMFCIIGFTACSSPLITVNIDRSQVRVGEIVTKESPQQKQTKEQR